MDYRATVEQELEARRADMAHLEEQFKSLQGAYNANAGAVQQLERLLNQLSAESGADEAQDAGATSA